MPAALRAPSTAAETGLRFVDWLAAQRDDLAGKGLRSRHALKEAAAQVLEQDGVDALTLQALAERAGLTRTAFYKHYPTLPDLLQELVADFQTCLSQALRRNGRAGNLADAVRATNLAYVHFFAANARTIVSVQHLRRHSADALALQFDLNDWWAHKIAQTVRWSAGGRQQASRLLLATAYALEAMVDGLLTELYVRRNPALIGLKLSETDVAEVLTRAWLGALDGPAAPADRPRRTLKSREPWESRPQEAAASGGRAR